MNDKTLRDLAPRFKKKHQGWLGRWFGWACVGILTLTVLADAALHQTLVPTLEKAPGLSKVLKDIGVLPPNNKQ